MTHNHLDRRFIRGLRIITAVVCLAWLLTAIVCHGSDHLLTLDNSLMLAQATAQPALAQAVSAANPPPKVANTVAPVGTSAMTISGSAAPPKAAAAPPTSLPAKSPQAIGPVDGPAALVCTGSVCSVPSLVKSGSDAPLSPVVQAFTDWLNASAAADKTAAALATVKESLTLATTADKAAQDAKDATRAALAALIGPTPIVPPGPPQPPPAAHTVELQEIGGTACPGCRAIDKAIADAKAAGVAAKKP